MSTTQRETFNQVIKDRFAPALRVLGFKGSGNHFLRVREETINAVSIQGSKYGDGCFVNLGLHFSFLPPNWTDDIDPMRKWKEIDCEFRWCLLTTNGNTHLWKYPENTDEATLLVDEIISAYHAQGESLFDRYRTPTALAEAALLERLKDGNLDVFRCDNTKVRYALTLARIHAHLGNKSTSMEFAEYGLSILDGATLLIKPLEELAHAI